MIRKSNQKPSHERSIIRRSGNRKKVEFITTFLTLAFGVHVFTSYKALSIITKNEEIGKADKSIEAEAIAWQLQIANRKLDQETKDKTRILKEYEDLKEKIAQLEVSKSRVDGYVTELETDLNTATAKFEDGLKGTQDKVNERISTWMSKIPQLVPELSPSDDLPSEFKPFIFFHIRKGGGSSLRQLIDVATQKHNITKTWIPGHNVASVPCFIPPTDEQKLVYASHINYMQITQLQKEFRFMEKWKLRFVFEWENALLDKKDTHQLENGQMATYNHVDENNHLFDCVTNLRPTVERVVSCWNFRFRDPSEAEDEWDVPPANELSPKDWKKLLPRMYDRYGTGCNNEIARIFGSSRREMEVNSMTVDNPIFVSELEAMLNRMSKCVVVLPSRCEDSNKIIDHFIPWMKGSNICSEHSNVSGAKKEEKVVSDDAKKVILEQNVMDELLYEFGVGLFEKQLEIATMN